MASDESMLMFSSMQEDEYDDNTDDGFDHQPQPQSLSRLSVCTSSMYTNDEFDQDDDMGMFMSRLSIESFDGDADEEFSDEKEGKTHQLLDLSSDSDKELPSTGCYSLPATPPRRRSNPGCGLLLVRSLDLGVKEYASENDAQTGMVRQKMRRRRRNLRRRRVIKEKWVDKGWDNSSSVSGNSTKNKRDHHDLQENYMGNYGYGVNSVSGESEAGVGGGVMVITRPKGGRRSLCMDLEEVKACKDLGFELEHERMLEMPSRVSLSAGSPLETSSGGNSPIANWRISSPGDDPRDVKARIKVWAQAVALASTSRHGS